MERMDKNKICFVVSTVIDEQITLISDIYGEPRSSVIRQLVVKSLPDMYAQALVLRNKNLNIIDNYDGK